MNQRLHNAMRQLAERADAVRRLEAAYGRVVVERGRQAAVIVHGVVLEWDEAVEIAAALRERDEDEASHRLASDGAVLEEEEAAGEGDPEDPGEGPFCPYKSHHQPCDCGGAGGDR